MLSARARPCLFPGCPKLRGSNGLRGLCSGHVAQQLRGEKLRLLVDRGRPRLLASPDMPGTLLVPLSQGYLAIVDESDGPLVGMHNWSVKIDKKCRTQYAFTMIKRENGKRYPVRLHRFLWKICGLNDVPGLDHENTNGLDCRRENLRPATRSQNAANTVKQRRNKSGFKGVSWSRDVGKWQATIIFQGRSHHLGFFVDPADGGEAYRKAAVEFHGEFARTLPP